jgi:hypothetical protein
MQGRIGRKGRRHLDVRVDPEVVVCAPAPFVRAQIEAEQLVHVEQADAVVVIVLASLDRDSGRVFCARRARR